MEFLEYSYHWVLIATLMYNTTSCRFCNQKRLIRGQINFGEILYVDFGFNNNLFHLLFHDLSRKFPHITIVNLSSCQRKNSLHVIQSTQAPLRITMASELVNSVFPKYDHSMFSIMGFVGYALLNDMCLCSRALAQPLEVLFKLFLLHRMC